MRSVEIFLNFPMLDINRNALLNDTSKADPAQVARLTRFWGDESWRDVVHESYGSEFFKLEIKRRTSRSALVDAFQKRLKEITKLSRER